MKIGLLGMGTIGSGVYAMLEGHPQITIKRILDRRTLPGGAESLRTERVEDILDDPEIDTVVELLGGVQPAHNFALRALRAGKNLVSANKLMLSADFAVLLRAAQDSGAQLRISASVGGGIPWLPNLLRARRLAGIQTIGGIVNGTTNFILDAMQRQGMPYAEALALAQRLGYAEANPSADVDGFDARSKLALSASIAFDALIDPERIPTAGIRGISVQDIEYFRTRGWVCRLLARAQQTDAGIAAWVEPALVGAETREASVLGNDNCISFTSPASGALSFIGQGAGQKPTAFAVVGDLADALSGAPAPQYVTRFQPAGVENDRVLRRYYVRADAPLPFPAERVDESAFLTEPVSVRAAHEFIQAARKAQPDAFFAGILDE